MKHRVKWLDGRAVALVAAVTIPAGVAAPLAAQEEEPTLTVTWRDTPIRDVLIALAEVSGRSIVVGEGVEASVTANIADQPWSAVLDAVLTAHGLLARESESGILRVEPLIPVWQREAVEPVVTRVYRIRYLPAAELQPTLVPLLTERGSVSAVESTNSLVVTDVPRVQATIAGLLWGGGAPNGPVSPR